MLLKFLIMLLAFVNKKNCQEFIYTQEPLNAIVIGDWGGTKNAPYTTTAQLNVALEMQMYSQLNKLLFVLSLGDNIYPTGIISVDDERLDKTYKNVYRKDSMENVPWYLILGNLKHINSFIC
jgi:tartrate-resistant acid phosphatase type 5